MYCPNCNTENKPEANYCRHCSQKFDHVITSTLSDDAQKMLKSETAPAHPILKTAIAGGLILGGLVIKQLLNKESSIPLQEKQQHSERKEFKETPVSQKALSASVQVQRQREDGTQRVSEACEIVVCMVSMPNPGPMIFLPTTYMNFQAETRGQKEPHVVATGSRSFQVNWSELEVQALEETRERREDIDALREKLKKGGWQPSSHGECWYSYRFIR